FEHVVPEGVVAEQPRPIRQAGKEELPDEIGEPTDAANAGDALGHSRSRAGGAAVPDIVVNEYVQTVDPDRQKRSQGESRGAEQPHAPRASRSAPPPQGEGE